MWRACVRGLRIEERRETETSISRSRRGVMWMCSSFYADLPSSYMV